VVISKEVTSVSDAPPYAALPIAQTHKMVVIKPNGLDKTPPPTSNYRGFDLGV
jgi:hypothetical protein